MTSLRGAVSEIAAESRPSHSTRSPNDRPTGLSPDDGDLPPEPLPQTKGHWPAPPLVLFPLNAVTPPHRVSPTAVSSSAKVGCRVDIKALG